MRCMSLSMSLGNTKLEMTKLNFRKKNPRSSIFFTCQIRFQNLIVFWSFTACFKQTNGIQGNLAKKTLLCFCLIIILNKYPWNPKMLLVLISVDVRIVFITTTKSVKQQKFHKCLYFLLLLTWEKKQHACQFCVLNRNILMSQACASEMLNWIFIKERLL